MTGKRKRRLRRLINREARERARVDRANGYPEASAAGYRVLWQWMYPR